MDYNKHLTTAINTLFNDFSSNGFWDEANGKIIESLFHDKEWNWHYKESKKVRYGLFTLSMVLLAKDLFKLDLREYESKIIRYLGWIKENKQSFRLSDLTYGGLLCCFLGHKHYNIFKGSEVELISSLSSSLKKVINESNNEHNLVLIASKYCSDLFKDGDIVRLQNKLTKQILLSQSQNGFFFSGDLRAFHHQRTMYTLWGLAFSSYNNHAEEVKIAIKKTICWVWKNRRSSDGGFIWHPDFYWVKNKWGFKTPIYLPKSSKYLFECHQTFFCNSILLYNHRFNKKSFSEFNTASISWIFGKNRINQNLTRISSIGVPPRIMNLEGNLFISNQQFKGSYEIGSYIFSLSGLCLQGME